MYQVWGVWGDKVKKPTIASMHAGASPPHILGSSWGVWGDASRPLFDGAQVRTEWRTIDAGARVP